MTETIPKDDRRRATLAGDTATATEQAAHSAAAENHINLSDYLFGKYGPLATTKQAAEVIQCHPSHVRAMCQAGDLPAVRIGDRWRIRTADLAAMIEGSRDGRA